MIYSKLKITDKFLNTFDCNIKIGSPTTSKTLSITEVGLTVVPVALEVICGIANTTILASVF